MLLAVHRYNCLVMHGRLAPRVERSCRSSEAHVLGAVLRAAQCSTPGIV